MEIALLIATTNQGKIREIKKLFKKNLFKIKCYSIYDYNIEVIPSEIGKTFLEIAKKKSVFYSKIIKDIFVIGEDSGLEVNALNGEPGIFSARYAGERANDQQNIKKLLNNLENIADRTARFVSAIAISKDGRFIKSFNGKVEGLVLEKTRGKNGFGYDPIFYYPPLKKTFAELSTEQKNKISHRYKSLKKLKDFLPHLYQNAD